jgi:peptidyl-prolyl cis-trans isomerase A (cyclophilin A)
MATKWILVASLVAGGLAEQASADTGTVQVAIKTSAGDFLLELDPEKAPVTVENFLKYVNAGFYKGTIFHRVIDGFMIQGGGFTMDMKKKTTPYPPIALESRNGLKNKKYTVAAARGNVPESATSQFFINVVDNPRLDYPNPDGHGYAVFGRVIGGQDVVDKIRAVKTTTKAGYEDVPMEAVLSVSASVVGSEPDK